jgi:hypothetical protein
MTFPAANLFKAPTSYQREDGIWVFGRRDFCEFRFNYNPGEHVVFGGPTQRGKTTLAFGLLEFCANPTLPAYVAVSKPDDYTTITEGERLHYRRVSEWPPVKKISEYNNPPSGYLIWPKFGDIHTDVANAARVTGDLLGHVYANGVRKKKAILVLDDTMVKAKIMGLDNQMVTILAMAGAMGIGLWIFVQKPTDSGRTTVWGYEQSTHLFYTKGGDDAVLKRYAEIAGDKGSMVKAIVPTLKPYQFLYLHKYEGWLCIVDKAE